MQYSNFFIELSSFIPDSVKNNFWPTLIGTLIGFFFGVVIYWKRLGQVKNEMHALFSLNFKTYKRGDKLVVKAGTDLKPIKINQLEQTLGRDSEMRFQHDEGVAWHHTGDGWFRARILHVYFDQENMISEIYRICHLDLKNK